MNNYTPNMLKTFSECQMKFFYRFVEKIMMPQPASTFEKGKKIHALASYYLTGFDVEMFESALSADEKIIWQELKNNKYLKFELVKSEYNLSCRVRGKWLLGRLDALVKDNDDYYILDYKTGSAPKNPESDFQTITYLLAVESLLSDKKIKFNSVRFVYIDLKNKKEHEIILSEQLKNEYEKIVSELIEKIDFALDSKVFGHKISSCKFCEYKKICEFYGVEL